MSLRAIASALQVRHYSTPQARQILPHNPKVNFEKFLKSPFRELKECKSVQFPSNHDPQLEYVQFLRFLAGEKPAESSRKHLPILDYVYLQPPPHFKSKMNIVGCFVRYQDQFLFLKQHSEDTEADTWGVPGGKIAKSETAFAACIREVSEETGLKLKTPQLLSEVYIRLPEMDFVYKMYEAVLEEAPKEIKLDPKEHTDYSWMTLHKALTLPLIRGEDECILLRYWDKLGENRDI